jgi:hypothetical protein
MHILNRFYIRSETAASLLQDKDGNNHHHVSITSTYKGVSGMNRSVNIFIFPKTK